MTTDMKKFLLLSFCALSLTSCALLGNVNWDTASLISAAGKAATAASISDAQIIALCEESVYSMDKQATIDNGTYQKRINKLFGNVKKAGNLDVNFKVYKTKEINAFACGDGSVRVYSGLMDVMTDEELVAIIGHEIGHLVHQDTKKAMKQAYLSSAARDLVGAAGAVGAIASTTLGDISESFISAQYSQKQEYAADDYGYDFAVSLGYSKYAMYNALSKLVKLSNGTQSSAVAQMFASHPNSQARAAKMKEKADASK